MLLKNSFHEYGLISKNFHHLRLLLLIGIYTCIVTANYVHKDYIFSLHMQFGITLLVVMIFNIIWRLLNTGVTSVATNKTEEKFQMTVYFFLYLTVFATPILGFSLYCLKVSFFMAEDPNFVYSGFVIFKFITLPAHFIGYYGDFLQALGANPKSFVYSIDFLHKAMGIFILPTLIALHIIGLIYQHFFVKNPVVTRML